MSDEKFQEFLEREATAYNTPPAATPRDEMWQVIAAARARRGGAGSAPSLATRSPFRRYAPWIGMAATLLVGVGIGRFALQRETPLATPGSQVADGTVPSPTGAAPATSPATAPVATSSVSTPPDAPATRTVPAMRGPTVQLVAATTPSASGPNPMQVASREHLTRAEAFVTVVAATPADALMDSLTGRWAREMLTNTRLLLDSPAGDDPVRRRLLEDLETLLVQLVQRSGAATEERELIDRTLQRTQLLTRLRSSVTGL